MDPNNIQNGLNGVGNNGHGNFNNVPVNQAFGHSLGNMAQPVAPGQYNPMLLQPPYFNLPFGMNYGNNQLFDVQSQQPYLMQQQTQQQQRQQQQQQQQLLHHQSQAQQQQLYGMSSMFTAAAQQQQVLQLMHQGGHSIPASSSSQPLPRQMPVLQRQSSSQQQQQQFPQQPSLNYDQVAPGLGRNPFAEQYIQVENERQERERQERERQERERQERERQERQLLEIQRKQEMEEHRKQKDELRKQTLLADRRRQDEQNKLIEKERQEEIKRKEEASRLAEEKRIAEEKERMEKERMQKFAEERYKRDSEVQKQRSGMEERLSQISQPLTLVGTHFLPNFLDMIPFPYESMTDSSLPHVFDIERNGNMLNNCDQTVIATISGLLSSTTVDDIVTRMDKLRPDDKENNDLFLDKLPPIIQAVVSYSNSALDVDSHNDMELLENEDVMMTDITTSSVLETTSSYIPLEPVEDHRSSNHSSSHSVDSPAAPISIEKRRQMMSVGKAPKAGGGNQRKKRDMVENLYDSLTDNFVPSDGGRRGRRRQRGSDDEDDDLQRDLDLIAAMEAGEQLPASVTGVSATEDDVHHFFETRKKRRKEDRERRDRSPTPTDVIDARDAEWQERLRLKQEREKNRKTDEENAVAWSLQALADNETFGRFCQSVDAILEQCESLDTELKLPSKKRKSGQSVTKTDGGSDEEEEEEELDEIDPDLRIELAVLEDLRRGSTRIRDNHVFHNIGADKLMKFITMLDRNMRDAISADNQRLLIPCDNDMDASDLLEKEICDERVRRAVDAAVIALNVMSSHKMHKQVIIEDVIERSIGLARLLLLHIIYPASDSIYKMMNSKRKDRQEDMRRRKKIGTCNRDKSTEYIYERLTEILSLIAVLVKSDSVPDTSVHNVATIALTPFFVANVGSLQISAMVLACNIFSRADDSLRFSIITDILSSLHRAPQFTQKNTNNGHVLPDGSWISSTTALFIQLVQSTIKVPKYKKHTDEEDSAKRTKKEEGLVKESFLQASKVTNAFLNGFLAKCSQKGNKMDGEEDYRILFSNFLSELLSALYSPEWPAAEMILTALGSLLVKNFRCKSTDMTIRQASLEYLGNIAARLRKGMKEVTNERRLDSVVKKALFLLDDKGDLRYETYDSVDISELTTNEKLKILESSLVDYLVISNSSDIIIYACTFYVGEWYKETVEDIETARLKHKETLPTKETEKEVRKAERRYERLVQKGAAMKMFLSKLLDKKEVKRRLEKSSTVKMLDSDAKWAVKFLAQSREFSHSFETYLKHIVFGAGGETVVALRSKALKCLNSIIEVDSKVLILDDVKMAVNSRMVDSHAQVRESAVDLIGRFVLYDEDYVRKYYNQIAERILDTGVAVRKRVIRIMREICEKFPSFEMIPDMLSRMIRRVTDEEGVKKLVYETFTMLWFQPVDTRSNANAVATKVTTMCSVAQHCIKDSMSDYLEMLILHIVKNGQDSAMSISVKQIVDSLVDHILNLEVRKSNDKNVTTSETEMAILKEREEKYMAYLSTLAIFSKVRSNLLVNHVEVLLPYLTFSGNKTPTENQVTKEMIGMLERVIPLVPFPNPDILNVIDDNLSKIIMFNGMALVVSAVSCVASIYRKFNKGATKTMELFNTYSKHLEIVKRSFDNDPKYELEQKMFAILSRSVFSVGVLSRYFSFEKILSLKSESVDETQVNNLKDKIFILLEFFSRCNVGGIRPKALTALGHFCAQHSSYLTKKQLQNTYLDILHGSRHGLQQRVLVLQNLEMFLQCEEQKLAASHEHWEENKDMQNLKEMELSGSGLGSSVIQKYWKAVLESYVDSDMSLRRAAVQVVWLTLNQGLVTPGASIPTLIAMTTDPVDVIRNRIDILLKEIDSKYSGMVQSKAMQGVRLAYSLHFKLRQKVNHSGKVVRGYRFCDFHINIQPNALPEKTHDGMAVLSGLYQSLRTNRQQRRSFLQAIVKLFSEETHDKPDLTEYLFIADNLAMFPYQMIDEPLYVIRQIDQNVAQTGQSLLVQYKHHLQMTENDDEDLVFVDQHLMHRLSQLNQTETFHNLFLASQVPSILLYVRTFLMQLYGFNEAKVAEYLPSEAVKVYEKAVTRRNIHMFKPITALEALDFPYERGSFQHIAFLAEKIGSFRKMLLSLDQTEDVDVGGTLITANQDDEYDEEDDLGEPEQQADQ